MKRRFMRRCDAGKDQKKDEKHITSIIDRLKEFLNYYINRINACNLMFGGSYVSQVEIMRHRIAYFFCVREYTARMLPDDFPHFKTKGRSKCGQCILITPHSNNYDKSYLIIIDPKGKIVNYKKIKGFAYAFRKYVFKDGTVWYAYLQTIGKFNESFDDTHLVILDDKLDRVIDDVSMLKYGSICENGYSCDNHEYVIKGKNHYIITSVKKQVVYNVPGFENVGIRIINSIIQEQDNGAVVFQFELSEHPELYQAALYPGDFDKYVDSGTNEYSDCGHLNSVDIDPITGDWLLSYRAIGLVKISRKDGTVKWVLGRKRCDVAGMFQDNICLYQHDARYQEDGSITVFDNYGSPNGMSRIVRYWIDEDNLVLKQFKEYETKVKRSAYMGGAQLVDADTETFEIAYGSAFPYIAFEEYDFKNKKQNMKLIFKEGFDLYQVFGGTNNIYECK